MTLISITGLASDPTYGRDADAYESSLDQMFAIIESDTSSLTPAGRRKLLAEIDAIIDGDRPVPITAAMRAQAKPIRLDPLAKLTADFWRSYAKKNPKPARRKGIETHVSISPLSRQRSR